ncbi:hypothetical protein D3C86_2145980 [compost metagenome]
MCVVTESFQNTLAANRTISIQVDEGEVGKAVFVLLRLDDEENFLAILMHDIII